MSDEAHPIDELKKLEPASLRVVLVGGEERMVAVPKIRNRWSRVHQVIDSLAWMRIEALDKGGGILGVKEADNEPELVDGEEPYDDDEDSRFARAVERMTKLSLDTALKLQRETRELFGSQMKAMNEMLGQVMQAQAVLVDSYRESMAVQRAALAAEVAEGKGGDNPAVQMMLQLAMQQVAQKAMQPSSPPRIAAAEKKA